MILSFNKSKVPGKSYRACRPADRSAESAIHRLIQRDGFAQRYRQLVLRERRRSDALPRQSDFAIRRRVGNDVTSFCQNRDWLLAVRGYADYRQLQGWRASVNLPLAPRVPETLSVLFSSSFFCRGLREGILTKRIPGSRLPVWEPSLEVRFLRHCHLPASPPHFRGPRLLPSRDWR
jgi:hypothetical protein